VPLRCRFSLAAAGGTEGGSDASVETAARWLSATQAECAAPSAEALAAAMPAPADGSALARWTAARGVDVLLDIVAAPDDGAAAPRAAAVRLAAGGVRLRLAPRPALLAISPSYVPLNGGAPVNVTARGLSAPPGGLADVRCRWESASTGALLGVTSAVALSVAPADGAADGVGLVRCVTPPASEGVALVRISLNGGKEWTDPPAALAVAGGIRFVPPPAVTACLPALGPETGNTRVRLLGEGFLDSGAIRVRFGALPAVAATFVGPSLLEVRAPRADGDVDADSVRGARLPLSLSFDGGASWQVLGAAGSADRGEGSRGAAPTFRFHAPLDFRALAPASGPATGGTAVTVTLGRPLPVGAALSCRFNGTTVPATPLNATAAVCASPPSPPGVLGVFLSVNGVDFDARGAPFIVYAPPRILALEPPSGPARGGTPVIVRGEGFFAPFRGGAAERAPAVLCRFGGSVAGGGVAGAAAIVVEARLLNATAALCVAPPAAALFAAALDADGAPAAATAAPLALPVELSFNGADFGGAPIASTTAAVEGEEEDAAAAGGGTPLFTLLPDESVASVAPAAVAEGAPAPLALTVSGHGFVNSARLSCRFAHVPASDAASGLATLAAGAARGDGAAREGAAREGAAQTAVSDVRAARFLSPTRVLCELPAGQSRGQIFVSVANNGVDFSPAAAAASLSVGPRSDVILSDPLAGPVSGGTRVLVALAQHAPGMDAPSLAAPRCAFNGTVVQGVLVAPSVLACVAPPAAAAAPGRVALAVSLDGAVFLDAPRGFA
jgi:hypothetical protein